MHSTSQPGRVLQTSKPPAVDHSSQPHAQALELKLEPATPLEYVQTAHLNADEWKGPLTMDEYLDREILLQETDLTKDGRITGWILTSDAHPLNPDGTRPIFASCESIPVHAYIARDGNLEKVQAHGIASVYTRQEYRGKGYASRMMAELGKRLELWQQSNGTPNPFSVLYSDIGQSFYANHGWKVFPSNHIHLVPLDQSGYDTAKIKLPPVDDLTVSDLQGIPFVEYLEERLQQISKTRPGTPHVAIRPDLEHFCWHFARDEFQSELFGKGYPTVKGAVHRETGLGLIWCRVYAAEEQNWQLHILHTVYPPTVQTSDEFQNAMAALLLRSQLEAQTWDMAGGVEVWDPSELVVAAAQKLATKEQGKVEIITRDAEHLCSLRWAGEADNQNPVWVANEKYAWC